MSEALRELRTNGLSRVLEENPPEHDPQSNGSAEARVILFKKHFRTVRPNLETEIGHRIYVRPPFVSWMVCHVVAVVTWCAKGHDGCTAY